MMLSATLLSLAYLIVLAHAAPTSPVSTLSKRQIGCNVELAETVSQDDITCTGIGFIAFQGNQVNLFHAVDFNSCQKLCKRNPSCISTEYNKKTSTCRLMDNIIEGFVSKPSSSFVYSESSCWEIFGNCPPLATSFDGLHQNSTIPEYKAMVHPWGALDFAIAATKPSAQPKAQAKPSPEVAVVSQHPIISKPPSRDGANFLAAQIKNDNHVPTISQATTYPFGVWGYSISYDYNFAKFVKVSPGTGLPLFYEINIFVCNDLFDSLHLHLSAADNKWKTHRTGEVQVSSDCANDVQFITFEFQPVFATSQVAGGDATAQAEAKFTAYVGLDALNITAIPTQG